MAVRILRREHGLAVVEPPGEVPRGFALAVKAPATLCFLREGELEREIAIARQATTPSIVSADELRYRALALRASLGVSLATFLARHREEGGVLDDVVASTIGAGVAAFRADLAAVAGEAADVAASSVWLGWDGSVRVYAGAGEPHAVQASGPPDATALAGVLAAMFREQRARELEWLEELFIEEITEAQAVLQHGPSAQELVHGAVTVDDGLGAPFLVTDLVPNSVGVASSRRVGWLDRHAHNPPNASPLVNVGPNDAAMICALLDESRGVNNWRLPTSAEFDRYSRGGGIGIVSTVGVRGLCRVWEWTSTEMRSGLTARGGKYRDRRALPVVENISWDDGPAPDIGFRAVRFLHDEDAPWEPRT